MSNSITIKLKDGSTRTFPNESDLFDFLDTSIHLVEPQQSKLPRRPRLKPK